MKLDEENVSFLLGPTNTGKTHDAIEKMLSYSSAMIGLPLRLLAREVYDKLIKKVGYFKVALITGEERIIPSKPIYYVSTVEAMPTDISVEFVAVDEIQLCNDFERGHIFTDKLLHARGISETLFLGSDSMSNIIQLLFPRSKIYKKKRRSKLTYTGRKRLYSLPKRSAVIAFKINDIYNIASKIKAVKGGAAVVIGALSPQTRNAQVSMFEDGTVDYIVATDAIGMGLNLNISNVAMSSLKKYDGKNIRSLQNTELAQIVGRAGRNKMDGYFGTTLDCLPINSHNVNCIENHKFEEVSFIYWRSRNLDFSTLSSLVKSLEKKSRIQQLVKTQNTRDENLLKYLATTDFIKNNLGSHENVKLLWEISTIPDYLKNLDFAYYNDLIKIYSHILNYGFIDKEWAKKKAGELKNTEGTIDVLTYRLSKIRFWNYVSNKKNWFNNSSDLKDLSQETEGVLSSALHKKLTEQFVDKKLHIILKEYNLSKKIFIDIDNDNNILINKKVIGKISGLKLILFNKESIFKNNFLKNQISTKIKLILKNHIKNILNKKYLNLTINENSNLLLNDEKIGTIYKGKDLQNPDVLLENDKFMDNNTYQEISEFIKGKLAAIGKEVFWQGGNARKIENKNIRPIIFALEADFGIVLKQLVSQSTNNLTKEDKKLLKNSKIVIGKKFIYYKNLSKPENLENRWYLSSLFFNSSLKRKIPEKNVLTNISNFNPKQLRLIGYMKIADFAVRVEFLEIFLKNIYNKKKSILYFNNYHYLKYEINFKLLKGILNYLGYNKIAGTSLVSYWKKPKYMKTIKNYNSNSPFYVLKKLQ